MYARSLDSITTVKGKLSQWDWRFWKMFYSKENNRNRCQYEMKYCKWTPRMRIAVSGESRIKCMERFKSKKSTRNCLSNAVNVIYLQLTCLIYLRNHCQMRK